MSRRYARQSGQGMILSIGMFFMTLLLAPLGVDMSLYYAAHQQMQTAADASALAAADALFRTPSNMVTVRFAGAISAAQKVAEANRNFKLTNGDVEFGYVSPTTGKYDPKNFKNPDTGDAFANSGGYNAVRITLRASKDSANGKIPSLFGHLVGIHGLDGQAEAVAIYSGGVTTASGLRPIFICSAAWHEAVKTFGDATLPKVTLTNKTITLTDARGTTRVLPALESCGATPMGNWGLMDLSGGNGHDVSNIRADLANGKQGATQVGDAYRAMPSATTSTVASQLQGLAANHQAMTIPMVNASDVGLSKNGELQMKVSQIGMFVPTAVRMNGDDPSLEGYFQKSVCPRGCQAGKPNPVVGDMTVIRLVH